ncbi:MAG: class I SAM-dependent methyltransferase, partial [Acidimicrobiia bacterium]
MSGALELSRAVYDKLAAASTVLPPRVRAWNGQVWGPESAPATLVLNHPGALRALLLPPTELTAGEAYVFGDVDVEGDLLAVLEFVATLRHLVWDRRAALGIVRMCRRLPAESRRREAVRPRMRGRLHSLGRDRQAVRHHYDTGNEFFAQFLGPAMVYSCAYFLGPEDTLAEAQVRKLDVICRKLQLQPGGRFLDVGCGWGGLVIHAARHYGVEAVGVTLSPEQASYARIRAKEEGVEEQVMVLEQDYREVEGRFDAVASVGMFEHVGRPRLSPYFESLHRLMAPGGSLLNHGITTRDRSSRRHPSFLRTYVFPD